MNARSSIFLATVLGLGVASAAGAASPTPALKTGSYAGQRVIVVVGDKTAYGGDGVAANKHPTTISYNASTQTYTLYDYDGGPGYSYSPAKIVASQSSAAYTFYRDPSTGSAYTGASAVSGDGHRPSHGWSRSRWHSSGGSPRARRASPPRTSSRSRLSPR